MFLRSNPSEADIHRFLSKCVGDVFSYAEVGATATEAPRGFTVDHNRIKLGQGRSAYERACAAIERWEMFNIGWVKLLPTETPIDVGRNVAILIRHFGFYSLNAARIVYTIDEDGDVERRGFAYGTLTEHGEIGEERFSVQFYRDSEEVWYDLYAFSRPGMLLAKIGYPLGRYLQRAFAADSKLAMLNAVSSPLK